MPGIAEIRDELLKHPRVERTWFEWELDEKGRSKVLVLQVAFDTDPSGAGFDAVALEEIDKLAADVLKNKAPGAISRVRVVPRRQAQTT
jgi:hypothetical protein